MPNLFKIVNNKRQMVDGGSLCEAIRWNEDGTFKSITQFENKDGKVSEIKKPYRTIDNNIAELAKSFAKEMFEQCAANMEEYSIEELLSSIKNDSKTRWSIQQSRVRNRRSSGRTKR